MLINSHTSEKPLSSEELPMQKLWYSGIKWSAQGTQCTTLFVTIVLYTDITF